MKKGFVCAVSAAMLAVGIGIGVFAAGMVDDIKAEIRRDFTVVIDGKTQTFKNAKGETVYPVLYEGTTYLPVRAIGEIMGKTVYWYEDEKKIELKDEGSTVTDADVIVDGSKNDKTPTGGGGGSVTAQYDAAISLDEAKSIALKDAGVAEADATFIKNKLERDDRVWQYEIDFYTADADYEYDINADTGKVIKREVDHDRHADHHDAVGGADNASDRITEAEAKDIALKQAGLAEADVTFTKSKLEYDDRVWKYEIEFYSGRTEFDAEIDAATGKVISWEVDD